MYRTKTNVFVHRTLLVLFFPSLFCQKTGFLLSGIEVTANNNIYNNEKTVNSGNAYFYIFF